MSIKLGEGSSISPKASVYGDIEVGDNCRIDDFCILTGKIKFGNNIHLACFSFLSGGEGIFLEDFSQFAPRTTMLTASDDYHGNSLVGPCLPDDLKPALKRGAIYIGRHALLGACTVVMPGVKIFEGAVTGAFSFVNKDLDAWTMYVGMPVRYLRDRNKQILELEEQWHKGLIR